MITVREATASDAGMIAALLRVEDRREVMRFGVGLPERVIRESIASSTMAGIFEADGVPLCIFGVSQTSVLDPETATPWLLGTDALDQHKIAFMRETRRWVREWQKRYRLLTNWVDADYHAALRWLQWLGFVVYPAQPIGYDGRMFHRVELRTP